MPRGHGPEAFEVMRQRAPFPTSPRRTILETFSRGGSGRCHPHGSAMNLSTTAWLKITMAIHEKARPRDRGTGRREM